MKFKVVIILFLALLNIGFPQWLSQQAPQNTSFYLTIDFLDNNNGVVGGWYYGGDAYGRIAYTSNSGVNWFQSQLPDTIRSIVTIQFINSQDVYAAGAYNKYNSKYYYNKSIIRLIKNTPLINPYFLNSNISDTSTRGVFMKSTDKGKTWLSQANINIDTFYYFEGMHFLDENTGYITGDLSNVYNTQYSVIIKTTNGGQNWIKFNMPDSLAFLRNIYFLNSMTGFAVGYYRVNDPVFGIQGAIIKTTNGGLSWIHNKFYYVNNFTSVSFANSVTGFACGVNNSDTALFRGVVYKTTNVGQNWFKLNYQLDTAIFEGINFLNGSGKGLIYGEEFRRDSVANGYVFENRVIVRTTDYGVTWFTQLFPDQENLLISSCLLDQYNWYISGGQFNSPALILHTTNGGGPILIEPISNNVPKVFFLYPAYPNPFNPVTIIKFEIPSINDILKVQGFKDLFVTLRIYDILGNQIVVLLNNKLKPGTYELQWNASEYPSGIYFLFLEAYGISLSQKIVLLK